jgi:hypothetical protein
MTKPGNVRYFILDLVLTEPRWSSIAGPAKLNFADLM